MLTMLRRTFATPRRVVAVLLFALLPAVALQAPSHAETIESYSSSYTGIVPQIYYPRLNYQGPTFTAPATTPAGATITSVSVDLGFTLQPSNMYYQAFLCADAANTQCVDVSPTGAFKYNAGWTKTNITGFAGYPASTAFHFVVRIQDGQTGSIIPALNPYRYSKRQNATVTYTY